MWLPKVSRASVMIMVLVTLALGGCTTTQFNDRPDDWNQILRSEEMGARAPSKPQPGGVAAPQDGQPTVWEKKQADFFLPGSGELVRPTPSVAAAKATEKGKIKINFQNANLLEVIKVIMTDILGLNYVVDPAVQGVVSMQTTRGLKKADLIPTLEMLLRMNNAALIKGSKGLYRIVPLSKALTEVRAPQLGDASTSLPPGYSIRIVPLKYISAQEMAEILEPFLSTESQLLRVDSRRNLLILASVGGHMDDLLDMVSVFDVDQMKGMSVGFFTLDFVDVKTLNGELEKLLADPKLGLMAGLVRFIPVERLNGLIVVATRPEHLKQVRTWIARLDRTSDGAGRRLYVYRVQHGKAAELAEILSDLFGEKPAKRRATAKLAPGLTKKTVGEAPAPTPGETAAKEAEQKTTPVQEPANSTAEKGLAIQRNEQIQIIADEPNNALLVLASTDEYRQILGALKQLDVNPMQVLIEVTIAEITLSDKLSYGVEWFFRNHFGSKSGVGTLDLGSVTGLAVPQPSFSYVLQGAAGSPQAILNMLAQESNLSVISSPTLLVLNNEEASIQVGDEVPVSVQQQQATSTTSNIVNSIEYRETGIVLKVKPRINAGGLVFMDVEQEASQVPTTSNAESLTPRIRQRKVKSSVAVHSGDTIVLGGLIQDNRDRAEVGVPFLHKIPVLGAAFGNKERNRNRTELIVLITPHAVKNRKTALQATETFRRRLHRLIQPVIEEVPPRNKVVGAEKVTSGNSLTQ